MTQAAISGISPFFIVRDVPSALSFYRDRLGFEITFQEPADAPFFGIVSRGRAMIMLKDVAADPLPNYKRESAARWDAYLYVPDPDALATEFASRNVEFSEPLKDTEDGLRGFELKDADGYVLFFGRPQLPTDAKEAGFIKSFHGVRYQTSDVARAIAFYTDHLGFQVEHQQLPAFANISLGSLKILLSGPGASGSRPMPDGHRQEPGGWNRVVLRVSDLEKMIAACKEAGLKFRNEMEAGPGGKQIQLLDPDGNPIELFEPAR